MTAPKIQRFLATKFTHEEAVLIPLLITYDALKTVVVTLAPYALALLLVFTPFASGWAPEPVMLVTTASAERARNVISTEESAKTKNHLFSILSNPLNKRILLDQVPNHILARMCELREITGVDPTDRENMINRLIQS